MSSTYVYCTRIIPGLSVVGVVLLLLLAFVIAPYGTVDNDGQRRRATTAQLVLSIYTVLLHLMSIAFPARVCWAMGDVIQRMKEAARVKAKPKARKTLAIKTAQGTTTYPAPLLVIIIPAYKEEMQTLEDTLRVLASHYQARHSYHIYLAMEEKEENSASKATNLVGTFHKSFYKMSYTIHPSGIPGEAQGKSSNESWAAKQAVKDYPEEARKNIVMTTMDADTHLSSRYFAQLAKYHTDFPETNETTIYVPPLVFDRNLHHVPLPVRTADLMWAGAGLSSLYDGSNICIPTSVYSLPMTLVEDVGGWDTGPGAIGEDMHMYLKCFFALSGNLSVRVIYAAASQCNVSSDGVHGFKGYMDGLNARYKQALRHMWGAMDTGYAIRQTFAMIGRHYKARRPAGKGPTTMPELVLYARDIVLTGMSTVCSSNWAAFHSSAGMHKSLISKSSSTDAPALKPIHKGNALILFHRLFEAHFLPIHLATILTTSTVYDLLCGSLVPWELNLALQFSGLCRLIGWLLMCYYFHRYEQYHRMCVKLRREEMQKAGLLAEVEEHDGFSPNVFTTFGILEAGMFPIGGFIFGAIPACQAVLSHLFTDRLTYHVSLKPQFALKRWRGGTPSPTTSFKPAAHSPAANGAASLPSSSHASSKSPHARCPSDQWKQAFSSSLDHVSTAMRFNQPVKRKD